MFFVRQHNNQCGLHAIQNMFKSAAMVTNDMHTACVKIEKDTGDPIINHESMGGDWSVAAIITALELRGYKIHRAVESRQCRQWSGDSLETLLKNEQFRGMIVHQPMNQHFTCLRPEQVDGQQQLFYVDSQADGPIRISTRLAERRCLAPAYSWEPYCVMGGEMEYVAPVAIPKEPSIKERPRLRPSAEFMKDWHALRNNTQTQKEEKQ
tara:strand:- start:760 stop:1386 length:627 start_codon:yes stop_codon:yes gene_type:complete